MRDVVCSISDVPGVFASRDQIIRSEIARRLHHERFASRCWPSTTADAVEPNSLVPGMPVHSEVEIRKINAEDNPAKGGHGLFTRTDGPGIRTGEVIGEYVGEVRDEKNRREMTRINFVTESNVLIDQPNSTSLSNEPRVFYASESTTNTRDDQYTVCLGFSEDWLPGTKTSLLFTPFQHICLNIPLLCRGWADGI